MSAASSPARWKSSAPPSGSARRWKPRRWSTSSDKKIFDTLFDIDLAEVCITSNAMASNDDAPAGAFRLNEVPGVAVVVEKAVGTKCARSWKILPTVGDDAEYPDVSPRDAQALREWKALGVTV